MLPALSSTNSAPALQTGAGLKSRCLDPVAGRFKSPIAHNNPNHYHSLLCGRAPSFLSTNTKTVYKNKAKEPAPQSISHRNIILQVTGLPDPRSIAVPTPAIRHSMRSIHICTPTLLANFYIYCSSDILPPFCFPWQGFL